MTIELSGHRVIIVPLTKDEVKESVELGKKRTELNEKKLGWKYRHSGMDSSKAHAVGDMGETAVTKWLTENGIPFKTAPKLVESYKLIQQDITIVNICCKLAVGVKTTPVQSHAEIFRHGSFLYPAKNKAGESKRILPYPDVLIQVAVSVKQRTAWLIGYTTKDVIKTQGVIGEMFKKPVHFISHEYYVDCDRLLIILNQLLDEKEKLNA